MRAALGAAWKLLACLFVVRLGFALVVGAVPAGAVSSRTAKTSAGELALFDREGALLAELARRPPSLAGVGLVLAVAVVLAHLVSLPIVAASIDAFVHGKKPLARAVGDGLAHIPALLVVSVLSAAAVVFAGYLGLASAAQLVALFPPGTPARAAAAVVLGGIGLVPTAAVAIVSDAVRTEIALGRSGWSRPLSNAWGLFSERPVRLIGWYALYALASAMAGAVGALVAAGRLVSQGHVHAWLGVLSSAVTLAGLVVLRGAWLASLARRAHERSGRGGSPVSLEAASESLDSPGPDEGMFAPVSK